MATTTAVRGSRGSARWLVAARLAVAAVATVLAMLALVSWWRAVGPERSPGPFPPDPTLAVGLALTGGAFLLAVAADRARHVLVGLAIGGALLGVYGVYGIAVIGEVDCVESRQASLVASSWPADLPCDALRATRAVGHYLVAVGLVSMAGIGILALGRRSDHHTPAVPAPAGPMGPPSDETAADRGAL